MSERTPLLPEPPVNGKTTRRWLIPVAIATAFFLGAAIGYAARGQDTPDAAVKTATVTITEPAVPPVPTFPESSPSDPFPRGAALGAFGWTVKVVDFNPDATDEVEQANKSNAPPREGTYAAVTVRFGRTGGGSSDPNFDMLAALWVRGQAYATSDEPCCLSGAWTDVGTIPPGGSGTGQIVFDVPKGGLDSALLFLIHDPNVVLGFFAVN
jgi:hypothetical protein